MTPLSPPCSISKTTQNRARKNGPFRIGPLRVRRFSASDFSSIRRSASAILAHDFVKRQAPVEHFGGGFGKFQAPFVGQLPQAEMDRLGQIDFPRNDAFALGGAAPFAAGAWRG